MVMGFGGWVNDANAARRAATTKLKHIPVETSVGLLSFAVGEELHYGAFSLPGATKQPSFQGIEPMGRSEKTESAAFPDHDSRRLRTDFDDVGV
jgi:hypothetical protein